MEKIEKFLEPACYTKNIWSHNAVTKWSIPERHVISNLLLMSGPFKRNIINNYKQDNYMVVKNVAPY